MPEWPQWLREGRVPEVPPGTPSGVVPNPATLRANRATGAARAAGIAGVEDHPRILRSLHVTGLAVASPGFNPGLSTPRAINSTFPSDAAEAPWAIGRLHVSDLGGSVTAPVGFQVGTAGVVRFRSEYQVQEKMHLVSESPDIVRFLEPTFVETTSSVLDVRRDLWVAHGRLAERSVGSVSILAKASGPFVIAGFRRGALAFRLAGWALPVWSISVLTTKWLAQRTNLRIDLWVTQPRATLAITPYTVELKLAVTARDSTGASTKEFSCRHIVMETDVLDALKDLGHGATTKILTHLHDGRLVEIGTVTTKAHADSGKLSNSFTVDIPPGTLKEIVRDNYEHALSKGADRGALVEWADRFIRLLAIAESQGVYPSESMTVQATATVEPGGEEDWEGATEADGEVTVDP